MKLRILDYLTNICEQDGAALCADLCCACGGRAFEIYHSGKQTKGILSPYIVRKKNRLAVKAVCTKCGCSIVLFDSGTDGARAVPATDQAAFIPFLLPKFANNQFPVRIKYNYLPENFKAGGDYTNRFENCFIYLLIHDNKELSVVEE